MTRHPRTLTVRDVSRLGVVSITTPGRTLLDLASTVDEIALEDALDEAIRRQLVTAKGLAKRVRDTDPRGRCGIPVLRKLLHERIETAVSDSTLENIVRRAFNAAGLPPPVPQFEIFTPDGSLIARVDFAYPDARLAIEVDGYEFHSSRAAWERDRLRQNEIVSLGWFVLRTTKRQIRAQPERFVMQVWRRLTTLGVAERHQKRRAR
jgi:hypothetical protein